MCPGGGRHITPDEESHLYEYYGLSQDSSAAGGDDQPFDQHADGGNARGMEGDAAVDTNRGTDTDADGHTDGHTDRDHERGEGHASSGRNTDEAMTRSEEQLKVGTETREAGKARLCKYIVTEEQTVTVPVSREEVRLEREPITDATAVVTEEVRKEQIDTDGVDGAQARPETDEHQRPDPDHHIGENRRPTCQGDTAGSAAADPRAGGSPAGAVWRDQPGSCRCHSRLWFRFLSDVFSAAWPLRAGSSLPHGALPRCARPRCGLQR